MHNFNLLQLFLDKIKSGSYVHNIKYIIKSHICLTGNFPDYLLQFHDNSLYLMCIVKDLLIGVLSPRPIEINLCKWNVNAIKNALLENANKVMKMIKVVKSHRSSFL